MKMIYNKMLWMIVLVTTLSCPLANARQRVFPQQGRERLEAAKTAYLSRQIKLTPEEARMFWPVYDQYQDEMAGLRKNRKETIQNFDEDLDAMSESEINAMIDTRLQHAEAALAARKKMIANLKQFLPPRKIAIFLRAEQQFNNEMQQRLEKRNQRD